MSTYYELKKIHSHTNIFIYIYILYTLKKKKYLLDKEKLDNIHK